MQHRVVTGNRLPAPARTLQQHVQPRNIDDVSCYVRSTAPPTGPCTPSPSALPRGAHAAGGKGRSAPPGCRCRRARGSSSCRAGRRVRPSPSLTEQPADVAGQLPAEPALFFRQRQPPDQKQVFLRRGADLSVRAGVLQGHQSTPGEVAGVEVSVIHLFVLSANRSAFR